MLKCSLDLYGNDEGDFSEQVQDEKPEPPAKEPAPTENIAPAPSKSAEPVANGTLKTEPIDTTVQQQSYSAPTSAVPAPATQQIPTYEQPQPAEYREPPPPRNDGTYSNIPVPERTVRPSEMKDEG